MSEVPTGLDQLSTVKRALHELRDMRAKLDRLEQARQEPMAIVGMGCRLPGASSPDAFWTLLHDGVDAITEVPADRWSLDDYFDADPDAAGKMYVRHGGFISNVDRFDARFFGITPREADTMDPQQRLLLEVTWEALEHGGIAPATLMGQRAGVFIGISTSDYFNLELRSMPATAIDAYLASGGCQSVAAGRLSYALGLQGPAVSIDTACSSSLVAIHLACQSLRSGESALAIAGGVSLMLMPELTINFCRARMLSPDGRCKTFDKSADGYVRGEGCGVVVLKRLSDAIADGDRVLALVRGSAVNQDGRSSGLTVPNGPAQQAVIREALQHAGVAPGEVQYVEAHGTGTSLGDPIEVQAIGAALSEGHSAERPLLIGSAKTNLGHLEAAAGVAGLMKVVLALEHSKIPAHLHFREPNPHVRWADLPIRVAATMTDWRRDDGRRIAGVSSFGFSGTNAHVIVEEAPVQRAEPSTTVDRPVHVLALSAKNEEALRQLAGAMADRIPAGAALSDVCYTSASGRSHFEHRLAVAATDTNAMRPLLRAVADGGESDPVVRGRATAAPPVAFLFTGQGSQYAGMGRPLYDTQPTFRRWMDRCDEILRREIGRSILPIVFDDAEHLLDQTEFTQPAVFALEYSLFELWKSWGVHPAVVMGHSLGEDVAACAAGVFSLEDGLRMIAARGRLMQALPQRGAMAAVFAGEAIVRDAIRGREHELAIAAINGPETISISGATAALEETLEVLRARGTKTKPMTASHAFHSPLMDPMLEPFTRVVESIALHEPSIDMISTLTGAVATAAQLVDSQYWARHVRQPVQFAAGIAALLERGCHVFVEIGPAPTLLGLGRRCVPENVGTWLPTLRKGRGDWEQLAGSVASLYVAGVPVNWRGWDADYRRSRVALPTYPFQRERHWAIAQSDVRTAAPAVRQQADQTALWNAVTRSATDYAERVPMDLSVASYPAKWSALEALTTAFMVQALRTLGVFTRDGEAASVESLLDCCEILAEYRVLIGRWLRKLSAEGLLEQREHDFVARAALPEPDLRTALEQARAAFAGDAALLDYVEHCGHQLADVLTGKESPLETLFPGGSSHLALPLYETSPVARYFNGVARAAAAAAAGRALSSSYRVLEIGAGTGGTTAAVLPVLAGTGCSYTFTDLGTLFLSKAQERFADYPFVEYAQLDIERDPARQGFTPGDYDVIVAANVLHATRNLHATIDRALGLLRPGGLLLLLETTRHPSWFDISTGLIHGWQIFEDELRGDHPLIDADQWTSLLRAHGAEDVESYPSAISPAGILGQHIILARAPAIARAQGEELSHADQRRTVVAVRQTGLAAARPVSVSLRERLAGVSNDEIGELILDFVRNGVARVLRLDPSALGTDQRLMDLGVDSLMAVELRNVLAAGLSLGRKLPVTLMFDYPTVEAIAAYLRNDVLRLADASQAGDSTDREGLDAERAAVSAIESMDDEAVEALLNKSLGAL